MCHSIVSCQFCFRCTKCCPKSSCRSQTSKFLGNLARSGSRTKNNPEFEGRLCPPLPGPAQTHKISHSHKLLCQSPQEQLPVGGIASAYRQKCSRTGSKSNFPGVFQPTFSSSQTQQQMETNSGPEQIKPLPQSGEIQDGNTGNHQNIPPTRGVGHLSRLQRRLLPHTNTGTIQEIPQISYPGPDLPIQGTTLWSVHMEFTVVAKEVKLMASHRGIRILQYLDDWLVRARSKQLCLLHTQIHTQNVSKTRLAGEHRKIRIGTKTNLKLRRLPIRPPVRSVRPTPDRWQSLQDKIQILLSTPTCPVRQFMSLIGLLTATEKQVHLGRLHMRPIQWHLKNNWRVPESLEKVIPLPSSLHPHLQWWLEANNVLQGQPLHPIRHALQIFTDASKEGWGAHLNELTARGSWSVPESNLHINYLELKAVFLALKEFQDLCVGQIVLVATDNTTVVAYIKQGRRHEVGPTLCPTLENLNLVFPETSDSKSQTHSGPPECDSGQAIQTGSDNPDRVVPPSRSFSEDMQQMAPTSNRSICHEVQSQVTSVCIPSAGLPGCSSGCTHSAMGGPGCLCLSTHRHLGQSGGKDSGLSMPKAHSDRPGVAQHA